MPNLKDLLHLPEVQAKLHDLLNTPTEEEHQLLENITHARNRFVAIQQTLRNQADGNHLEDPSITLNLLTKAILEENTSLYTNLHNDSHQNPGTNPPTAPCPLANCYLNCWEPNTPDQPDLYTLFQPFTPSDKTGEAGLDHFTNQLLEITIYWDLLGSRQEPVRELIENWCELAAHHLHTTMRPTVEKRRHFTHQQLVTDIANTTRLNSLHHTASHHHDHLPSPTCPRNKKTAHPTPDPLAISTPVRYARRYVPAFHR